MSFILDCSSGQKACESISYAFSCSENELRDVLTKKNIDKLFERNWGSIDIPYDQYLYNYIIQELGPHKKLESVNWFHTTRTLPSNNYKDGIKPLGQVLPLIWESLIEHAPNLKVKENLLIMQSDRVADSHYEAKSEDSLHWGPYGILVREVAFYARELCQHDYLDIPEIVEDICNGYREKYKKNILEHYKSLFVPKIVKFNSSQFLDVSCVEAALCYLYEYVRGNPPRGGAVLCFDGEGVHIKSEYILSVEKISP